MDDSAFLSVRVPHVSRRLIKQIAAQKGTSVQELVGGLVNDFIVRELLAKPSLAEAVKRLRGAKAGLREYGVAHIDLFGSIVRDEAHKGSDIDIVVEFKQRQGLSLSKFASLQKKIENILGFEVDLAEREALKPEVKQAYSRDALRVF